MAKTRDDQRRFLRGTVLLGRGAPRISACILMLLVAGARAAESEADAEAATAPRPGRVMLASLYRLGIGSQVAERARELARGTDARNAAEIIVAIDTFRDALAARSREELENVFGKEARSQFTLFVEHFTQAEKNGDLEFLGRIVPLAGPWGENPPTTYPALSTAVIDYVLVDDVLEAGRFLADVQTWLDLRKRHDDVPSLHDWLARHDPPQQDAPPPRKRNPLRDAEAEAGEFEDDGGDSRGMLAQFGTARADRRKKALEDARAGMQQVAEERRAAEDEAAARKLAAAQAEADAVRKQAEKLAAAESEAIEQRRNSWSGRLKSVLTTAIGATSGAFLGNVGSRAGEAAAEALFNSDGHHRRGGHHRPPPQSPPPSPSPSPSPAPFPWLKK